MAAPSPADREGSPPIVHSRTAVPQLSASPTSMKSYTDPEARFTSFSPHLSDPLLRPRTTVVAGLIEISCQLHTLCNRAYQISEQVALALAGFELLQLRLVSAAVDACWFWREGMIENGNIILVAKATTVGARQRSKGWGFKLRGVGELAAQRSP